VKKTKPKKTNAVKNDKYLQIQGGSDGNSQTQADMTNVSKKMLFNFAPDHPLENSYCTQWLPKDAASIPNFIGSSLPRSDQGD